MDPQLPHTDFDLMACFPGVPDRSMRVPIHEHCQWVHKKKVSPFVRTWQEDGHIQIWEHLALPSEVAFW